MDDATKETAEFGSEIEVEGTGYTVQAVTDAGVTRWLTSFAADYATREEAESACVARWEAAVCEECLAERGEVWA